MARDTYVFGKKLKEARLRVFLTQVQLGELLDPPMSDENISRIERVEVASVRSKQIPHLAKALDIPLDIFTKEIIAPPTAVPTREFEQLRISPVLMKALRDVAQEEGTTAEKWAERALTDILGLRSAEEEGFTDKEADVASTPQGEVDRPAPAKHEKRRGGASGRDERAGQKEKSK